MSRKKCNCDSIHRLFSRSLFFFALMAIAAAFYGWAMWDIWLASTQWMEIASVLILMAIYVRMSEEDDLELEAALAEQRKEEAKAKKTKKVAKKTNGKKGTNGKHKHFKLTK